MISSSSLMANEGRKSDFQQSFKNRVLLRFFWASSRNTPHLVHMQRSTQLEKRNDKFVVENKNKTEQPKRLWKLFWPRLKRKVVSEEKSVHKNKRTNQTINPVSCNVRAVCGTGPSERDFRWDSWKDQRSGSGGRKNFFSTASRPIEARRFGTIPTMFCPLSSLHCRLKASVNVISLERRSRAAAARILGNFIDYNLILIFFVRPGFFESECLF